MFQGEACGNGSHCSTVLPCAHGHLSRHSPIGGGALAPLCTVQVITLQGARLPSSSKASLLNALQHGLCSLALWPVLYHEICPITHESDSPNNRILTGLALCYVKRHKDIVASLFFFFAESHEMHMMLKGYSRDIKITFSELSS